MKNTYYNFFLFFILVLLQVNSNCQNYNPFYVSNFKNNNGTMSEIEISFNVSDILIDGCNFIIHYQDEKKSIDSAFYNYISLYNDDSIFMFGVVYENNYFFYFDTLKAPINNKIFVFNIKIHLLNIKFITRIDCMYFDINSGPSKKYIIRPKPIPK